jgi:hypothetical protein
LLPRHPFDYSAAACNALLRKVSDLPAWLLQQLGNLSFEQRLIAGMPRAFTSMSDIDLCDDEMGFKGHFAKQRFGGPNVCFVRRRHARVLRQRGDYELEQGSLTGCTGRISRGSSAQMLA